jgi:hypothetical protein
MLDAPSAFLLLLVVGGAGCSGACRPLETPSPQEHPAEQVVQGSSHAGPWPLVLEVEDDGPQRSVLLFLGQAHQAEYVQYNKYTGVLWRLLGTWSERSSGSIDILLDWIEVNRHAKLVGAWAPSVPHSLRLSRTGPAYKALDTSLPLREDLTFVRARLTDASRVLSPRSPPMALQREEWGRGLGR